MIISRDQQMVQKVVMVDGFPGCGKTMLSPIISAFSRVEMMQYAPVIEQVCELWGLNKMQDDVAESMIKMNADLLIYNIMMGRNSNCRPEDISSIFKHRPLEHIKRMLSIGDEAIPNLIKETNPILHLTTHMLLPVVNLILKALEGKLIFIEVVRHPLYMIIQHEKNFDMLEGARNQHVRYTLNRKEYTFFTRGWEKEFDQSNSFEKAVHSIAWYYNKLFSSNSDVYMTIPFELFVKNPEGYLQKISSALESPISDQVREEMEVQKVPREQLSDAPALEIYKRCGWTPPSGFSEEDELKVRRELVAKHVSSEVLTTLDDVSKKYEDIYLNH